MLSETRIRVVELPNPIQAETILDVVVGATTRQTVVREHNQQIHSLPTTSRIARSLLMTGSSRKFQNTIGTPFSPLRTSPFSTPADASFASRISWLVEIEEVGEAVSYRNSF